MTFKVNHAYTSTIPDDPADLAAGKITPSRWNADLVATMNSGRIAGRVSSGSGAVEELDSSAVAGFLGLGSAAYSSTGDFAPSSHTHSAADITSGTFADARIAQSNVTQHQSALSISWTQVGNRPTTLAGYGITDAAPLSHVGSGGAAHANAVPNGAAGFMTGADKNKLDGIQAGATANSSDAFLLNRANHTGTQTASTISDFAAAARAETEAELIAGTNITITPAGSGPTRTLTISATGGGGGGGAPTDATYVTLTNNPTLTNERALTAGAGIGITDGGANSTVTVANTDRGSTAVASHEAASDPHPQYLTAAEGDAAYAPLGHVGSGGSAHANAVPNGAAGFMTGADKSKLDGIQAGATANSSDSFLLNRANHTGTQTASTISDFAAAARAQTEAELIAGSGITITPAGSGANRTLTLSATGGGGGYPSIAYPRRTSTPKIAGDVAGTNLSTLVLTASRQYFIPLVVPVNVTLTGLRISVTTASAGAANIGIYANTQSGGNDTPGARIAQITATLDTGTTGDRTGNFASSVTLTAGTLYWVSVIGSAAATIRALAVASVQTALGRQVNGTGAITHLFASGSGSTLPDPAPGSLSDGTGVCPAIYLIE